jgi:hypothetical protein
MRRTRRTRRIRRREGEKDRRKVWREGRDEEEGGVGVC